jgi:hypothetical protein
VSKINLAMVDLAVSVSRPSEAPGALASESEDLLEEVAK